MRELAEAGKHVIGGTTDFIECRMNGKYAEYRVAFAQPKPRHVVEQFGDGSVSVSYI